MSSRFIKPIKSKKATVIISARRERERAKKRENAREQRENNGRKSKCSRAKRK